MSASPPPEEFSQSTSPPPAFGRRVAFSLLMLFALAAAFFADFAEAGKGRRDRDDDSGPRFGRRESSSAPAQPRALSKSTAIESVITALAMNGSPTAEQTLEKVVTGRIAFGAHGKQAAQLALLQLILHPTPQSEAFLIRIFSDSDDAIRPGDKGAYPATALRSDAARALAQAGSPQVRLALAKIYTSGSASADVRAAIEEIVKSPASANFAAQIEVFRSPSTPDVLKESLQTILFEKNASAVKQALKLEASPASAFGGSGLGIPSSITGLPLPGMAGAALSLAGGVAKMFGAGSAPGASAAGIGPANQRPPFGPGLPAAGVSSPGFPTIPRASGTSAMPPMTTRNIASSFAGRAQAARGGPAAFGAQMPMGPGSGAVSVSGPGSVAAPSFGTVRMPGMQSSIPGAPQRPATGLALDAMGQAASFQPVDARLVAGALWNAEFVRSLAGQLASEKKTAGSKLIAALASIPLNSARSELKDFLEKEKEWGKGPAEFGGKLDSNAGVPPWAPLLPQAPHFGQAGRSGPAGQAGRPRFGRRGKKDDDEDRRPAYGGATSSKHADTRHPQAPPPPRLLEFGTDWFDPGSLVVLKTAVPYTKIPSKNRPKEKKTKTPNYSANHKRSPSAQKRAEELAEKKRHLDAKYDWRDAIEKLIRDWDDRFAGVADAGSPAESEKDAQPADAADKESDSKPNPSKTKPFKARLAQSDAKFAASASDATDPKIEPAAPIPSPSVALPFSLHAGGKIAKEFHLRWPQDLPSGLSAAVTDPLVVHYVRLEGTGEFGKTLAHYGTAISASAPVKPRYRVWDLENGKWLDIMENEPKENRTRSIDVFVTRESADDEKSRKSGPEELTVEILVVEIASLEPESSTGTEKKESLRPTDAIRR